MKFAATEIFYSIQGEGKYVGVPSVFLRMFGCNFRCQNFGLPRDRVIEKYNPEVAKILEGGLDQYKTFKDLPIVKTGCDTYASIYPEFKRYVQHFNEAELATMMTKLLPNNKWDMGKGSSFITGRPLSTHLVITGGEPLLGWQRAYPSLLDILWRDGLHEITFETNGTQMMSAELREHLSHGHYKVTFSVSPKLAASGHTREEAIIPAAVKSYDFPYANTYLKFVVDQPQDLDEVNEVVDLYHKAGVDCPVYLMPVGGTGELYYENNKKICELAMKQGYRYSPRLQVDLFKNAWGT
jgi:7-carboxy-7-deazaguanine synthase